MAMILIDSGLSTACCAAARPGSIGHRTRHHAHKSLYLSIAVDAIYRKHNKHVESYSKDSQTIEPHSALLERREETRTDL